MDLIRPREETTTEDLQAGVIRAIYKSPSRRKLLKDSGGPQPVGVAAERKRPAKDTDPAIAGQEHEG